MVARLHNHANPFESAPLEQIKTTHANLPSVENLFLLFQLCRFWVFLFLKYGKFWSISLEHFIKHKPLVRTSGNVRKENFFSSIEVILDLRYEIKMKIIKYYLLRYIRAISLQMNSPKVKMKPKYYFECKPKYFLILHSSPKKGTRCLRLILCVLSWSSSPWLSFNVLSYQGKKKCTFFFFFLDIKGRIMCKGIEWKNLGWPANCWPS